MCMQVPGSSEEVDKEVERRTHFVDPDLVSRQDVTTAMGCGNEIVGEVDERVGRTGIEWHTGGTRCRSNQAEVAGVGRIECRRPSEPLHHEGIRTCQVYQFLEPVADPVQLIASGQASPMCAAGYDPSPKQAVPGDRLIQLQELLA